MAKLRTSPAIAERVTIGRVLSLSWRAWIACRWHLLFIVAPVAMLRALGEVYLYAAVSKSLPHGWKEVVGAWIFEGIQAPAIAFLAFAAVRWAAGQPIHLAGVLRASWNRMLVAVVVFLVVDTMLRGPAFLIPDTKDLASFAWNLTYIAYALAVGLITFLLLPILMLERTSLAGALDRSIELISGHRWRIMALTLLTWVTLSLIGYAYRVSMAAWPIEGIDVVSFIRIARSFLTISVAACIPAAAYYLLRNEKQGPSPGTIAQVFD
jgi:hypothetical protein